MALESMRVDYKHGQLIETEAASDPFLQFQRWFGEAASAGILEPNAMTATRRPGSYCSRAATIGASRFSPTSRAAKDASSRRTRSRRSSSSGQALSGRFGSRVGSNGSPTPNPMLTSPFVPPARNLVPGPHSRARSCPTAKPSNLPSVRSNLPIPTARSTGHHTGAASGSCPTRSNSGKVGQVGSMTVSAIEKRTRVGSSNDSRPDSGVLI
jgi:hypothetical protein